MAIPNTQSRAQDLIDPTNDTALQNMQGEQESISKQMMGEMPAPMQAPEQPRINTNSFMGTTPLLLGLVALGGHFAGIHGKVMLNATNGMTKGLIQGKQRAYEDAKQKYDQEYKAYMDNYNKRQEVYREVLRAVGDNYQGRLQAIQISNAAVGYKMTADDNALQQRHWESDYAFKLKDAKERWDHQDAMDKELGARAAKEQAAADATAEGVGTPAQRAKKAEQVKARGEVQDLIGELVGLSQQRSKTLFGAPLPVTGLSGRVARISETVANITGASDETVAHDFQSKLSELLLKLPKLETGSGKSAKDERERVETIARGLRYGDTPQNTIQALIELDARLQGKKVVRTGMYKGRRVVQYSDGTTEYAGD